MNNKKLIFGITALVLVTAIFIISEKMSNAKPAEHRTKLFPGLEANSITGIIINEGGKGVRLEKNDGVWMVSDINPPSVSNDDADTSAANTAAAPNDPVPADNTSAQVAVEKITSMTKSDLVSENPANQAKFEVDSASGMTVEIISGGNTAAVLRIGKSGPDFNSNYVRTEGSDSVYLIRGGIKYSLSTDIERWKKKEPPPTADADSAGEAEEANIFGDNVLGSF